MNFHNFVGNDLHSGSCVKCGLTRYDFISAPSLCVKSILCQGFLMKSCCGGSGSSMWDNTTQQWICKDCGTVKSNDPSYNNNSIQPATMPEWAPYKPKDKQCVCGGTKAKTTHAHYCDIKN